MFFKKKVTEETVQTRPGLTLRYLCDRAGVDVPKRFAAEQDEELVAISTSVLLTKPGMAYFDRSKTLEKRRENVRGAYANGAKYIFTRKPVRDLEGNKLPCILCDEPAEVLCEVAAELKRETVKAKIIAVTGSIGKTSTKDMIRRVMSRSYNTVYSKKNHNGLGQVVRYVQFIEEDTEVYIQEAGLSVPRSIERAARVLQPDAFVVTNIGLNHVGYFDGKQENLLKEKLCLDTYAAPGAVGFINWDDPLLSKADYTHTIVKYAIDNKEADYFADDIVEIDGRIEFNIVERETGKKVPVLLNVIGKHNVGNAVCAYAMGLWANVPEELILEALSSFRTTGVRQNLTTLAGQRVYLDCYNASEGAIYSVAKTLDTITVPEGAKRIFVVADIDDKLGERTEEVHRRVGQTLAKHESIGLLICFGDHAAWIAEEAAAAGVNVLATSDRAQLNAWIREHMGKDDVIAFKGGQQMLLTKTIDEIFGTSLFMIDGDMVAKLGEKSKSGDLRYRMLEDYGLECCGLVKTGETVKLLQIPGQVDGTPLRLVGRHAFRDADVRKVVISAPVRSIAASAFRDCKKLKEVTLPNTVEDIDSSAFRGTSLKRFVVPEGVKTIGQRAFSNNSNLKELVIPASVKSIGQDILLYSPKAVVKCVRGSFAWNYCIENGINHTELKA